MKKSANRLNDYLGHILDSCNQIKKYTDHIDQSEFLENRLIQDAVIRNFEIIGEASRNIDKHYPDFGQAHPELPLGPAYQMRNAMAHGYAEVDLVLVWETICKDVPFLSSIVTNLHKD